MKRSRSQPIFVIVLAWLIGYVCSMHAAEKPKSFPKPTAHTIRDIEGWSIHIDDRLLNGTDADTAMGRDAIKLLEAQLHNLSLVMPADKVARLRKVPIWLDRNYDKLHPAQYHPSVEWLAGEGYDRQLARCVHIPDAADFVRPRHHREQPCVLMHELAHAYHDQVLGFEQKEVMEAWQAFVKTGKYQSVLHINGTKTRHYALTNQKEFFAEMTESYFGQNDFYPFNSGELKDAEPELFKLLQKLWGPLP